MNSNEVSEIIKDEEIPYPVGIASDKLAKDLKFKGIPTTIFVDGKGNIIKTFYGFHEKEKFAEVMKQIIPTASETKK